MSYAVALLFCTSLGVGCGQADEPMVGLEAPRMPDRIETRVRQVTLKPPNLVLVSIDTLRADRVSAYGHDRPTSPRLDRLAAEGVLFESAFSHSPKTAPSHMTLMTGIYPEAHRVKNRSAGAQPVRGLSEKIPTLAMILRAAGYATVARVGGANVAGDLGFARGFESYGEPPFGNADSFRMAAEQLKRLADLRQPFFLFVHTYAVHSPYVADKRYRDLFVSPDYSGRIVGDPSRLKRAAGGQLKHIHREFWRRVDRKSPVDRRHLLNLYDACIRSTDDQLGALLDEIDALELAERTIVVVLSDHGEEFGEHDSFEHDALW